MMMDSAVTATVGNHDAYDTYLGRLHRKLPIR